MMMSSRRLATALPPAPPRGERIDPLRDFEVRDWARALGTTRRELHAAIQAVGDRVDAVKAWLEASRRPQLQ